MRIDSRTWGVQGWSRVGARAWETTIATGGGPKARTWFGLEQTRWVWIILKMNR